MAGLTVKESAWRSRSVGGKPPLLPGLRPGSVDRGQALGQCLGTHHEGITGDYNFAWPLRS